MLNKQGSLSCYFDKLRTKMPLLKLKCKKCFKKLLKARYFEIEKSRIVEMKEALYSRPKRLRGRLEQFYHE